MGFATFMRFIMVYFMNIDCYGRECKVCGVYKKWASFYDDHNVSTGKRSRCIDCDRERGKKYRARYKEKPRAGSYYLEGFSQNIQDFCLKKAL